MSSTSTPPALVVSGLSKSFGDHAAVAGVSFTVQPREFVTLLGPSGCGKTTTLRCIAGLEQPQSGEISTHGNIVSSATTFVPPEKRNLGMVFQSYAIWPHMTVSGQLAYGLKLRRVGDKEIRERVKNALALVNLEKFGDTYPSQLSGGQQQRVALARAIVLEPQLMLFDEPLSNLDAKLRNVMREELRSLKERLHMTAVYVTHDQTEAMFLSDTLIVMDQGRIAQMGTPLEVYTRPINRFVAEFIGAANVLQGELRTEDEGTSILNLAFQDGIRIARRVDRPASGAVSVAVRPQSVRLEPPGGVLPQGTIVAVNHTGDIIEYEVKIGESSVRSFVLHPLGMNAGDRVSVRFDPAAFVVLAE